MNKRWNIKKLSATEITEPLAKALNVNSVIANLLVQRGVRTYDEAKVFFRPQLEHLHDPFLMKDMDKAISRIEEAIKNKEKVLIYGDYDVDGTSAVALVYSFFAQTIPSLTQSGNNGKPLIDFYIPDRYKEGYGISIAGIDYAAENNFPLIIALDCGIKAIEKIKYATSKNIDFIICDHHLPGEEIPEAYAVLDPKRKDCTYPYKELSGCGIGFKLIQAFAKNNSIPIENLEHYLDLAVISIAADIVPITGENRTLAYFGLRRLNTSPCTGVKAMLELANIKKELTISDIVFVIGPRINAAGRMESGKKAVELLISSSSTQATESGIYLNKNNSDRRELDVNTTREALAMIAGNVELQCKKTTVLFNPAWHKGVIGIVASRLTETYYRPTIMLCQSNGVVSGSARSVKNYDIYEALHACNDLLDQFGGHKYAAGLTLKPENVEVFIQRFEEIVSQSITDEMLIPEIEIDAEINLQDITPNFYKIIKQFAPFGPENMAPVFISKDVSDRGYATIFGTNHLKMDLIQNKNRAVKFPAVGFGLSNYFEHIANRNPFKVCYSIRDQDWEGKNYLQLQVKDIR